MPAIDLDAASAARIARIPPAPKRMHLIGIGGTAMAALAGMLKEGGYSVSGSDSALYEPTRSLLSRLDIQAITGYAASNLRPPPDLAVVGNVITRSNPEAAALLASSIPYVSMPEALWHFFLRRMTTLMVCGTHGKTTSTAMMAQVLVAGGYDPTVMIGGVSRNLGVNYRLGRGSHFVIEGDEYDTAFFDKRPKFVHYHPQGAILTSLEFDHADIYRDLEHVKDAFQAMVTRQEASSLLVVCADHPAAIEISRSSRAHRITYGAQTGEFRVGGLRTNSEGSRFDILRQGRIVASDVFLPTWGAMNVSNALGVYALLSEFGLSSAKIAQGLASFAGVVRRQEIVGEAAEVTVVDDFAHHPSAIAATLQATRERFAGRRILAAFEPRSNTSRRSVFQAEFAGAFDLAARIYLAPVYFKENDPIPSGERLSTEHLARDISRRGPKAFACRDSEELQDRLASDARPGDVVLIMSNGPFDGLKDKLLAQLHERKSPAA